MPRNKKLRPLGSGNVQVIPASEQKTAERKSFTEQANAGHNVGVPQVYAQMHDEMIAMFSYHYAVRLSYGSPYAQLPMTRRFYEEKCLVEIIMYLHTYRTLTPRSSIQALHDQHEAQEQLYAQEYYTLSEAMKMSFDAKRAIYGLFCALYPLNSASLS